jgi:hypothetical protein
MHRVRPAGADFDAPTPASLAGYAGYEAYTQ